MVLPSLASTAEATAWGFTVSDVALKRASARIRGYLNQQVTYGSSVGILARGPVFRLPERPVLSVQSVVDPAGRAVDYELFGSVVTTASLDVLTVTYTHGYTDLPDEMVELVCQIASRLDTPSPALAAGVQSEGAGAFSVTYGMDSYKAQAGLGAGEKAVLDRIWPTLPQIISMGSPA